MKIKVLYFSSLKDKVGKSSEELEIKEETTVEEFINFLKDKYPHVSQNLDSVMVAVNEEYVDKTTKLNHLDTVALIPPVSGG